MHLQALRLQRKLADEELGIREADEPSARDVLVKCAYVLCCVLTTHRLIMDADLACAFCSRVFPAGLLPSPARSVLRRAQSRT